MKIIDQDNSNFDIPTTFTIVKNNIYCLANSQLWNISSGDMKIIKPENLKEVLILRYRIN
ncbi:MAG: hypothetical protein MUF36_05010 [Bacteroidales bacterium]|nr:hypothetical protein [Bacteroidales bacterium]